MQKTKEDMSSSQSPSLKFNHFEIEKVDLNNSKTTRIVF